MGRLTTHVLDTAKGLPARNLKITLFHLKNGVRTLLKNTVTNNDGRCDGPMLEGHDFEVGTYELVFEVGDYFGATERALVNPPFLNLVPIQFSIADAAAHYHVPLLVSPWSYSTYRGS
ncbi:MAG: hydroxyisourate hydrolase [Proteobacteria bacterium]|nr:hydroxyisourate hydrolase [Pseudomonadota bacterium]